MKKLSTLVLVLVLVCGVSFVGCKKQDSQDAAVTEEPAQPAEAPATETPAAETK